MPKIFSNEMFCEKIKRKCAFASGTCLLLFGLFLLLFWEGAQRKIVSEKFKLSETSKTYKPWIKSRVPIYVQYYFFNWTNPKDLKDANYKPHLKEVGPYKFWEKIEKVNVTWNENGTVSYRRQRKWYFDSKGSNGTLNDRITTINVIALMAANMVERMPSIGRLAMGMMIAGTQKILVTKTVSEFLFEGYLDPLLTAGRGWPTTSSKVPYDKFGWFYKRNGSSTFDGLYNVHTGKNGMENFGAVATWNFKNRTTFYEGKCGEVKGSGGEYWPWNRQKHNDIYLFSPDLCRYIQYKFINNVKINDVDGFKYVADSNLFDNGTFDETNKCFCNGLCLPAGVLNISMCRYGAPVFTSYPHFYLADPIYINALDGMKPDQNLHENYIALEPNYGIPLEIAARIQINVLVRPNRYVALLNGVQQLIFPVFWLNQRVSVPSEKLTEIKLLLHLPKLMFVFSSSLIFLGLLCLSILAYHKISTRYNVVNVNGHSTKNKGNSKYNLFGCFERSGIRTSDCLAIQSIKSLETDF